MVCFQEQVHLRISCTGLVTALACHPLGLYCVAALSETINVWQVGLRKLSVHV